MRKWLSLILSVALLLCTVSSGAVVNAVTSSKPGDINMDGKVNSDDVRLLMRALVGSITLTADQEALADYNGNGRVDTSDAHEILLDMIGNTDTDLVTIDLLAPSVDDWYNPVQQSGGTPSIVAETDADNGGYVFTNVGGTWPYANYIYTKKLLLPMNALISYDLTVGGNSTSINLFVGGSVPDMDGDGNGTLDDGETEYVKLNSLISSTNIDAGSGDLTKGTYSGTIKVSDLAALVKDSSAIVDGKLWVSGLKIYSVGSSGTTVTIRTLKTEGYQSDKTVTTSSSASTAVRTALVKATETSGLSDLTAMRLYQNGILTNSSTVNSTDDYKKIYDTEMTRRVVNYPDGYQMDIMLDWEPDYTLSALRTRYSSDSFTLTVTKETKNPYGNTLSGWNTYFDEWLARYLNDSSFLSANNLTYTRTPTVDTTLLSGYTVYSWGIYINNATNFDKPYYTIAAVRANNTYNVFYLFVMKSTVQADSVLDRVVRSFKTVTVSGTAVSSSDSYSKVIPSSWSEETTTYYNTFCNQTNVSWGFFSASMVPKSDSSYSSQYSTISSEYNRLSSALNYDYDIMPTYTHLSYYGKANSFPLDMANEFAGGDGTNGKPVLQFTYQFTNNNNSDLTAYTPMYDIIRGKYDSQFRALAQDIKAYGKPILFRLNNEMNTDWTSYCGMVTLLDPDIFIQTWQRLYDIFEEEGVDNCIWIFNPIATTTPYCSWGEDLCYFPGEEYVQVLGLTSYEMGNSSQMSSFQSLYTTLYNKNVSHFSEYPWIIAEFGCGAGGERQYDYSSSSWLTTTLGRNVSQQANWVTAMFQCLRLSRTQSSYAFCKNIKGAVWFSANDSTTISGKSYITNYLKLDSSLTATINAFRTGLASNR